MENQFSLRICTFWTGPAFPVHRINIYWCENEKGQIRLLACAGCDYTVWMHRLILLCWCTSWPCLFCANMVWRPFTRITQSYIQVHWHINLDTVIQKHFWCPFDYSSGMFSVKQSENWTCLFEFSTMFVQALLDEYLKQVWIMSIILLWKWHTCSALLY